MSQWRKMRRMKHKHKRRKAAPGTPAVIMPAPHAVTPPRSFSPPETVAANAARDIKDAALRAAHAADAKKAAADAVLAEAERLRVAHEVTAAEHARLDKEAADTRREAKRLADEADATAAEEQAKKPKPWHRGWLD
jgi:hypothetical protein